MELVKNLSEIIENIKTLDEYLQEPAKRDFALKLIREGANFIAVKEDRGYRFYPSRYVGYKENNHEAYMKYNLDEGKDAGSIISQILKHNPKTSQDMENAYKAYCEELGFMAAGKGNGGIERRFWIIGLEE